jgi:hypothetical protein
MCLCSNSQQLSSQKIRQRSKFQNSTQQKHNQKVYFTCCIHLGTAEREKRGNKLRLRSGDLRPSTFYLYSPNAYPTTTAALHGTSSSPSGGENPPISIKPSSLEQIYWPPNRSTTSLTELSDHTPNLAKHLSI